MKTLVAIIAIPLALAGCGAVDKVEDRAFGAIKKGVDEYKGMDESKKQYIRERLDEELAPCTIRLQCPVEE